MNKRERQRERLRERLRDRQRERETERETETDQTREVHLWRVSHVAVSFVVNVSQLLLQVQLDPVMETNHSSSPSGLPNKDMLKP